MKKLFLGVATLTFAAAVGAQHYKWVDQDGKVRYGDTPPPGVKAQPLKPPPRPAGSPSAATKGEKDKLSPEAAFRKRQEDAAKDRDKQAQANEQAAAKKEDCARAQEALRTLESGQRIARTDSKGERYYMEDADIAKEAAKTRQELQKNCG